MINLFQDKQLYNYAIDRINKANAKNKRFCYDALMQYLNSEDNKVCGIYGLRRTGKTIMMLQSILDINSDNCLYIECNNNDSYIELENIIKETDKKYIFIDEITKTEDFIKLSAPLSDIYTQDKRIVITGTDSASLLFAKKNELYDRMTIIPTTYISFAEYHHLLNKDIEEYIKYGGTLTNGKEIYNKDSLEEYTNTSIISNIYHSIENAGEDNVGYSKLYKMYLNGSLIAAVNKTIETRAKEFLLNVINGYFNKSHILGSARDLVLQHRDEIEAEDVSKIDRIKESNIYQYVKDHIKMESESSLEESDINLITKFLTELNVLYKLPNNEIIFTQPGMQYAYTEVLMEGVIQSREYADLYPNTQEYFINKIMQDSFGVILDNVIKTDIINQPTLHKMKIGKADNNGNGEFDLYIINPITKEAIVYEIKRSFVRDERQTEHLKNNDFCNAFELLHKCQIVEKVVKDDGIGL